MTGPLLGKAEIEHALTRLGERLERRGVTGDVYVIGGAASVAGHDPVVRTGVMVADDLVVREYLPDASPLHGSGRPILANQVMEAPQPPNAAG
jgi:hypothetical protein